MMKHACLSSTLLLFTSMLFGCASGQQEANVATTSRPQTLSSSPNGDMDPNGELQLDPNEDPNAPQEPHPLIACVDRALQNARDVCTLTQARAEVNRTLGATDCKRLWEQVQIIAQDGKEPGSIVVAIQVQDGRPEVVQVSRHAITARGCQGPTHEPAPAENSAPSKDAPSEDSAGSSLPAVDPNTPP